MLSIPEDKNPLNDQTGKNCSTAQSGNVWFLAGTAGGSATGNLYYPSDKAILLPPLNAECSYSEFPAFKSEEELRFCSGTFFDQPSNMVVTIDNQKVEGLDKYRIQSGLFNVTFPDDNIYGVKSGPTQAVSDGYWILLHPLPPGNHQIKSSGVATDFTNTGVENFASEVTYNISVK